MPIITRIESNRNGHFVIEVDSLGVYTAEQELERLKKVGLPLSEPAGMCLRKQGPQGYGPHKLGDGEEYNVVVLPISAIPPSVRTVQQLSQWGRRTYGYTETLGGIALRLREMISVSPEILDKLRLSYILVIHRPIEGKKEVPRVFGVRMSEDQGFLDAWVDDGTSWGDGVGFAFLDPKHTWTPRS